MTKTKKEFIARFRTLHARISRAADQTGQERNLMFLEEIIERQERAHRAFGRRLVGAYATKGRMSVKDAVSYFVVRVFHAADTFGDPSNRPVSSLVGYRDDFAKGAIMWADERFREKAKEYLGEGWRDDAEKADYVDLVS